MLLRNLLNCTLPSQPDYNLLKAAVSVMQETTQFVNTSIHKKKNLDKIYEIQQMLDDYPFVCIIF